MIKNARELLYFYKGTFQNDLMRFWNKAFDEKYGGFFTCFSNDGKTMVSTDKYIWSQGRMLWIDSHYVDMIRKGILEGDVDQLLRRAEKTYKFIHNDAILPEGYGVCAYLCERNGNKKESIPGKGFYTSFYVDCFVIMGFAEYSRVCGRRDILDEALKLYARTRAYLSRGEIVSEPYPMPFGYRSHSVPMIMTNVTYVLYDALEAFSDPRESEIKEQAIEYVNQILNVHFDEERRLIIEMVPDSNTDKDTLLARHVNAGHAIESMWFCAKVLKDTGWSETAAKKIYDVVKNSLAVGWDDEMGGLYRITGHNGGCPEGRMLNVPYDTLLKETWDSKLWWPHSEALYVTLLCNKLSGDEKFRALYDKVSEYVFRVFPNPDKEVGEWIQILGRENKPLDKVVALPVKDPYHIMRNFMLIIELLWDDIQENDATALG